MELVWFFIAVGALALVAIALLGTGILLWRSERRSAPRGRTQGMP